MSVITMSGCNCEIDATASSADSAKPTTSKPPIVLTFSMIRLRINSESSTTKTRNIDVIKGPAASAHEIIAQGIRGEFSVAREIHFLENPRAVRTDRFY